MDDKPAIINFLISNHYIKENHVLDSQNTALQQKITQLQMENRTLTRRITSRNHQIAILEERIQFSQFIHERQMRMQRILVAIDNACHVFRRNNEGVFVQAQEGDDETEEEDITETEPQSEEEAEAIARRLGFETDSEGYISDDLMRSLLDDE